MPVLLRQLQKGFTAVELMVVVAIVAIVAALALPSFKPLLENWRIRQATEAMVTTIHYARSEAIKRGGGIRVQREATNSNCTADTDSSTWNCGWFVYYDANGSNTFTTTGSNPDVLLQKFPSMPNVNIGHANGGGAGFNLNRWGMVNGLNAKGLVFSPTDGNLSSPSARGICMGAGGRIKVIQDPPC